MICVMTGATSGIGFEAARDIAREGFTVIVIARDRARGEAVCRVIANESGPDRAELELADLSSLADVRALADRLQQRFGRIELLVNNAGLYCHGLERTADGFEMTMGVNHLAPFVLTTRLLPALRAGRARVVNVASEAHRAAKLRRAPLEQILRGEGPAFTYRGIIAYCDSKLANILFTTELERRERAQGLVALAVHPGTVATRIWNRNRDPLSLLARLAKPFMLSPVRAGGFVSVVATEAPYAGEGGGYFNKAHPARPSDDARDPELARELWEVSEAVTDVRDKGQGPRDQA